MATTKDKIMLHRAKELQEYAIHALDGELGNVRTFYFDEKEWNSQSMVVDAIETKVPTVIRNLCPRCQSPK